LAVNYGEGTYGSQVYSPSAIGSSLSQYKSDGVINISSGGWSGETTAVFKFSMSSSHATDVLTPQIEIRDIGSSFTNTATDVGASLPYTGTPVTGEVTVIGLVNGTNYHWQAQVINSDGTSDWVVMGGNPDFGIDTTAPSTPGTPVPTSGSPTNLTTQTWTWSAATDTISGIATYVWRVVTNLGVGVTSGTTTSTSTSTNLLDGIYHFFVSAIDYATNQGNKSQADLTVDATPPTVPGTPSTTSPTDNTKPTWIWTASTDSGVGLTTPAYTLQWSQDNTFSTGATTATINDNSFTHSSPLSDGTWYFRVKTTDAVNNSSSYSEYGTVTIDFGQVPTSTSNPNSSSSSSGSNPSSSSAPSCGNAVTNGIPDLFEIRTNKNTATLYFTPPTAPYSSFYISYSRKPDNWEYGVEYNQNPTGGVQKYTINMLKPNTKYYFKIRVGNSCATGNWGNTMAASTTNSVSRTKTYYKNVFTPIVNLVKSTANRLIFNKKTFDKPVPTKTTNVEVISTIKPLVTTIPPKEAPSPKPVTKNKFCILWWCF
jgi:hypothetical protein